ncbi:MAG: hypothetical protein LBC80_04295 [Treponema sp.]|jgi:hypothetical protein|nr:hypothetical protein [Treponema sp.]
MRYIITTILIIITIPAFAQSNYVTSFNVGNLGIGGNFPLKNDYNFETSLSLLNIGFENRYSNFEIGFSPLMFFGWNNDQEVERGFEGASLLNFYAMWNVINYNSLGFSNFYLGPFASINYLFVDENIHWNRHIFTTGINLGFRGNFGRLKYNVISFEMGYRNINNSSKYHVGVKMDIIALILLIMLAESEID